MGFDRKFGIGIVGCGTIASVHAEAIRNIDNAELFSVYSRDRNNATRLGEKFCVPAKDDWEDFIGDDRLDIISVCTPSGTHLDYGEKIAQSGKHVIVEKPIEVTLERGKQLIRACEQHDVKLAVIFQNRFIHDIVRMKKSIDEGKLGKIFLADASVKWFRDQAYYDSAPWRGTVAQDGGGVLINQAIHTIDLLQWMLGDVKTIFGQTGTFTHKRMEGEDTAVASLRFQSGALGVIQASTSIKPAVNRRITIHGEKGTAALSGNTFRMTTDDDESSEYTMQEDSRKTGSASPLQNFSVGPHQRQFEAIFEAIGNDAVPPVSGGESLKSLAVVLSVYESAKKSAPVEIQD